MADYLQPVNDGFRRLAVLIFSATALVNGALAGFFVVAMIRGGRLPGNRPLWGGVIFFGLIAAGCGWLTVRLWSERPANGVTSLPVRFIEVFGLMMLAATIWVGFTFGAAWGWVPGLGVASGMLLIRSSMRQRSEGEAARRLTAAPTGVSPPPDQP